MHEAHSPSSAVQLLQREWSTKKTETMSRSRTAETACTVLDHLNAPPSDRRFTLRLLNLGDLAAITSPQHTKNQTHTPNQTKKTFLFGSVAWEKNGNHASKCSKLSFRSKTATHRRTHTQTHRHTHSHRHRHTHRHTHTHRHRHTHSRQAMLSDPPQGWSLCLSSTSNHFSTPQKHNTHATAHTIHTNPRLCRCC